MYVEIEKNQFNLFQIFVEQVGPKKNTNLSIGVSLL